MEGGREGHGEVGGGQLNGQRQASKITGTVKSSHKLRHVNSQQYWGGREYAVNRLQLGDGMVGKHKHVYIDLCVCV